MLCELLIILIYKKPPSQTRNLSPARRCAQRKITPRIDYKQKLKNNW